MLNKLKLFILPLVLILLLIGAVLNPSSAFVLLVLTKITLAETWEKTFGPNMRTIVIDNNKFKIPQKYVSIAKDAKGQYKDSVAFSDKFLWPSYVSIRVASQQDYDRADHNHNIGHFWITKAFPEKVNSALQIKSKTDGIVKAEYLGKEKGFEKYQYFVTKSSNDKTLKSRNTGYFLRDGSGKITDAIYCYGTIAPTAYPPQCEYSFVDKGLLYAVQFSEDMHLNNAKNWKENTIKFIDQFRVNDHAAN